MNKTELQKARTSAESLLKRVEQIYKDTERKHEDIIDEFFDTTKSEEKNDIFKDFLFTNMKLHELVECRKELISLCNRLKNIDTIRDRAKSNIQD